MPIALTRKIRNLYLPIRELPDIESHSGESFTPRRRRQQLPAGSCSSVAGGQPARSKSSPSPGAIGPSSCWEDIARSAAAGGAASSSIPPIHSPAAGLRRESSSPPDRTQWKEPYLGLRRVPSMSPRPRSTTEEEDADEDLGEETLRALLEATRTAEGRSRLASEGIVLPKLVRCLHHELPLHRILSFLRLLRNLCAGEAASQDGFLEAGGPEAVSSVILKGPLPVPEEVVRLGLQLLGNVAAAGEKHQSAVWRLLSTGGFLELARVRDAMACDALCMILYMCCCSSGPESRERFDALCGVGRGSPIFKEIISTACSGGCRGDWLQLLLSRVCFEEPGLPLLFSEFSSFSFSETPLLSENGSPQFTAEQAFLLGILSSFLNEQPWEGGQISGGFALAVLRILEGASLAVDFTSRGPSPLPTGSPAVDALGYSLAILRDIAAAEDSSSPVGALPSLVELLVSSGICQRLLGLLQDLEPPSTIRRALHRGPSSEVAPPSSPSKVCPYRGFRRDLVAVIGNCTCGRRRVQDEIRQLDGILLLLQQSVVDEENPYLREWGMLAVSYLLEGNAENQRLVAELELQGSVDSPEVAELGLRVDLDKKTGRVKLVNA